MDAGYKGCCIEGKCDGSIDSTPFGFCHCDDICHSLNDCCEDITEINCSRRGTLKINVCGVIFLKNTGILECNFCESN